MKSSARFLRKITEVFNGIFVHFLYMLQKIGRDVAGAYDSKSAHNYKVGVIMLQNDRITVKEHIVEKKMEYRGKVILTYRISFPEFIVCRYDAALMAINKYYRCRARGFRGHVENDLYPLAQKQFQATNKDETPMPAYEVVSEFRVTCNDGCLLSLYTDQYEFTGGAHGNTLRIAQTWNLGGGGRVSLREFFAPSFDYRTYLLEGIKEHIEKEPDLYFENYEELAAQNFNDENFYCTPQGLAVYYQQYEIAPYSSGIRVFVFPFSETVRSPQQFC